MIAIGSVTMQIQEALRGNVEAAGPLWDRYFEAPVRLVRARWGDRPRRALDEEDIALDAFDSFFRGATEGRFPQLRDRDNLWPLLVVITANKIHDARRKEMAKKRNEGKVQGESAWLDTSGDANQRGIEQVIGNEPTPEFAAEVGDEMRHWLDSLGSDVLRSVAVWKMEGYTNREIAEKLGCSERSVESRLKLIRTFLEGQPG